MFFTFIPKQKTGYLVGAELPVYHTKIGVVVWVRLRGAV